jgi:hypothetical protein
VLGLQAMSAGRRSSAARRSHDGCGDGGDGDGDGGQQQRGRQAAVNNMKSESQRKEPFDVKWRVSRRLVN